MCIQSFLLLFHTLFASNTFSFLQRNHFSFVNLLLMDPSSNGSSCTHPPDSVNIVCYSSQLSPLCFLDVDTCPKVTAPNNLQTQEHHKRPSGTLFGTVHAPVLSVASGQSSPHPCLATPSLACFHHFFLEHSLNIAPTNECT